MSSLAFRKFCYDWPFFREKFDIPSHKYRTELYQCCSKEVQASIFASDPGFLENTADDTEDSILTVLKGIVTQGTHPLVHRMAFYAITQSTGETCQDFINRLRSAAPDCDYTCHSCKVDISKFQIRDQFVRGLQNPTLQALLLKSASINPDITLDKLLHEARAFEQSLREQKYISANVNKTVSAVCSVETGHTHNSDNEGPPNTLFSYRPTADR